MVVVGGIPSGLIKPPVAMDFWREKGHRLIFQKLARNSEWWSFTKVSIYAQFKIWDRWGGGEALNYSKFPYDFHIHESPWIHPWTNSDPRAWLLWERPSWFLILPLLVHSDAVGSILGPVHRLWELRPCVFLYHHCLAVSCGLCLDLGKKPVPPSRNNYVSQRYLDC